MGKVIKNDGSRLVPVGTMLTMTIDTTNNQFEADLATGTIDTDTEYYQIQAQCDSGAYFTLDGSDPTSAPRFFVDDNWTEVWNLATLRVSRWARAGAANGTLVAQGVEA